MKKEEIEKLIDEKTEPLIRRINDLQNTIAMQNLNTITFAPNGQAQPAVVSMFPIEPAISTTVSIAPINYCEHEFIEQQTTCGNFTCKKCYHVVLELPQ